MAACSTDIHSLSLGTIRGKMNWNFFAGYVTTYLIAITVYYFYNRKQVPKLIPPSLSLVSPGEKWSMDCGRTINKGSPWEEYKENIIVVTIQDVEEGYVRYYYGDKAYDFHIAPIKEFIRYRYKTKVTPIKKAAES